MEKVAMQVTHENGTHSIKVGDDGEADVQETVPLGKENGQPARLVEVFHPASGDLTIAKSTKSRMSAFGVDFSAPGKSEFSSPFSWAA